MAYDGFYGELSTRGAANEVLNLAIATKDQIEALAEQVATDAAEVAQDELNVTAVGIAVSDQAIQVNAQAIEVQNNATFVAQAISNVVLEDAPHDGQTYSRQDGQWVTGSTNSDFYNIDIQLGRTVEFFPGTGTAFNICKIYPRVNLSRPILSNCYVRRNTAAAYNLTMQLRSTDPDSTWQATLTIPSGETEGFFTSGTVEQLDAAWGIELNATSLTPASDNGIMIHLEYEVLPDPSLTALK